MIDVTPDEGFAVSARNIAGVKLVASNRVTARDIIDTIARRRDEGRAREAAGGAWHSYQLSAVSYQIEG